MPQGALFAAYKTVSRVVQETARGCAGAFCIRPQTGENSVPPVPRRCGRERGTHARALMELYVGPREKARCNRSLQRAFFIQRRRSFCRCA